MFTGLIESLGTLRRRSSRSEGVRLTIECQAPADGWTLGESVAVDGACLTVVHFESSRFQIDASPETLARTTLGERREGDLLHLERALRLGDRLGGHLVLGHVDGVGTLRAKKVTGDYTFLSYEAPPELLPLLVEKGSIAVDGVSLTVNSVHDPVFEVAIIPHTATHTHLARKTIGARVNLEGDMLAKHVARLLASWRDAAAPAGVTKAFLEKHGLLGD